MIDPTLPLFGLSPVSGKKIVAKFDGGLLSSDGGVLLLREAERFLRRLLRYIPANWPKTEILLRADSHYFAPETVGNPKSSRLAQKRKEIRAAQLHTAMNRPQCGEKDSRRVNLD